MVGATTTETLGAGDGSDGDEGALAGGSPPPPAMQAGMQAQANGRASLATLLALTRQIQAQNEQQLADGREMRASLAALQAALPEAYVPRREVEQRLAALQRITDDLDKRQVAQEEWRISQTRDDGARGAQFAGELERVRAAAITQVAAAKEAQTAREQARAAQVVSYLVTALLGALTLIGSYIMAHLPR